MEWVLCVFCPHVRSVQLACPTDDVPLMAMLCRHGCQEEMVEGWRYLLPTQPCRTPWSPFPTSLLKITTRSLVIRASCLSFGVVIA